MPSAPFSLRLVPAVFARTRCWWVLLRWVLGYLRAHSRQAVLAHPENMRHDFRMRTQIFRPIDYKKQQWKNGRGWTQEICISPADSNFARDRFAWRLSSAIFSDSGPFSRFMGYRRVLTLLEGGPLHLHCPCWAQAVELKKCDVAAFSGSDEVSGLVRAESVSDLSFIYRDDLKASGRWLTLTHEPILPLVAAQDFVLIYVLSGELRLTQGAAHANEAVLIDQLSDFRNFHLAAAAQSEARVFFIEIRDEAAPNGAHAFDKRGRF